VRIRPLFVPLGYSGKRANRFRVREADLVAFLIVLR
jgi:hypothetical protein